MAAQHPHGQAKTNTSVAYTRRGVRDLALAAATANLGCMRTLVTAVLVVVGLALIAVGIVYFTVKAGSLPSFFPGHIAGSTSHRTKHGIAAVALGAVVLAFSAVAGSFMDRR
jgi:hypothetical protein